MCGQRPAACPRRHGGGAAPRAAEVEGGPPDASHFPSRSSSSCRNNAGDRPPSGSPPGRCGTTSDSSIANHTGGPVDRRTDTDDWLDLLAQAGVRRLRLHDCRHSAATALLVLGADARVLMATMGWTSMALVQRYTHMVPELRRDVAERQATLWPRSAAQ